MLKNLVNFSILTTIVVLVWIGVSIYGSLTSTTISTEIGTQIAPIEPNFNLDARDGLRERTFVSNDLSEKISYPSEGSGSAQIQSEPVPQPITQPPPQPTLPVTPTPIGTDVETIPLN